MILDGGCVCSGCALANRITNQRVAPEAEEITNQEEAIGQGLRRTVIIDVHHWQVLIQSVNDGGRVIRVRAIRADERFIASGKAKEEANHHESI